MTTAAVVLAVVFVPMLAEAARAARNERTQRRLGGVEPAGDVYPVMRVVYPVAFVSMVAEGWLRGLPAPSTVAAGLCLFAAAKVLKWWAIASLGTAWTFRVIVVPGMVLVRSGPYRFIRHPNYVAVIGELLAVALMTGARIAGPVMTAGFALLVARRVAVERRALDAILRRS